MRNLKIFSVIFLAVCSLVAIYCVVHKAYRNPREQRYSNHLLSDGFSETNVLIAGYHAKKYGFIDTYFLSCSAPKDGFPIKIDHRGKHYIYTHYPPLPDIINGILRKLNL